MTATKRAFTLVELVVVLAIIAMLGTIMLPALASVRGNSQRITCLNNLKQIGTAFGTWGGNHSSRYPMVVFSGQGGASDYVSHSYGAGNPLPPSKTLFPGMVFMVMSNELATTKILFCPSDNLHITAATNFSYGDLLNVSQPPPTGLTTPMPGEGVSGNSKISYFVNGDCTYPSPQDIVSGDDNIGNQTSSSTSPSYYRFGGSSATESCSQAANGTTSVCDTSSAYNGSSGWWSWTANGFHQKVGNLSFIDGSCQMVDIADLHRALSFSTNSIIAEAFNFMP